jgi:hypothetical protein
VGIGGAELGPAAWLTPLSLARLHEPAAYEGVQAGKDIALAWGVLRTKPPWRSAVLVTANAGDGRARAAAEEMVEALVDEIGTPSETR